MNTSELYQKCMTIFDSTSKIFDELLARTKELSEKREKLENTYGFAVRIGVVSESIITALLITGIRAVGSIPFVLLGVYILSLVILAIYSCVYCYKASRLHKRALDDSELLKAASIKSKKIFHLCLLANTNNMLALTLQYKDSEEWKPDNQVAITNEMLKTHDIIEKELASL